MNDPLLEIAVGLEKAARSDDYFIERNLYPNVDFYSGIVYRALGIPRQYVYGHVCSRPTPRMVVSMERTARDAPF